MKLIKDIEKRIKVEKPIETKEEFKDALEIENQNAIRNISASEYILEIGSMLPVNFWVVDEKIAVFAIKSFEGRVFSYAFKTRDKAIIEALISSWDYYRWMAERHISTAI